jgi:uncharacterized protein YjdB
MSPRSRFTRVSRPRFLAAASVACVAAILACSDGPTRIVAPRTTAPPGAVLDLGTGVNTPPPCDSTPVLATSYGYSNPAKCTRVQSPETVAAGSTATITCLGFTSLKEILQPRAPYTYASGDEQIATVTTDASSYPNSGTLRAIAPGNVFISCGYPNEPPPSPPPPGTPVIATGGHYVTITGTRIVAGVTIAPTSVQVPAQRSMDTPLVATIVDNYGQENRVYPAPTITWSTDNANVATVSASGLVTGVAVGTAHVSASADGVTSANPTTVTVLDPPTAVSLSVSPTAITIDGRGTAALTTIATDQYNKTIYPSGITWTSSNPSIVSLVTQGRNATAQGSGPGTAVITATIPNTGLSGSATVTVRPTVTISGPSYGYDQTLTLNATPAFSGSYYYVWETQWCYNGTAAGDCDHLWHAYRAGTNLSTVTTYMHRQDYYQYFRVTIKTSSTGSVIATSPQHTISGEGIYTAPPTGGGGCGPRGC